MDQPFSPTPLSSLSQEVVSANVTSRQTELQNEIRRLRDEVDRLFMITQALWSILKHHHDYTDEHLKHLVHTIDASDGRVDGHLPRQGPLTCPSCGRKSPSSKPACLFCATHLERDLFQR